MVGSTDDSVSLKLSDNEETMAMWPHPFECLYKVGVGWVDIILVERRVVLFFLCIRSWPR